MMVGGFMNGQATRKREILPIPVQHVYCGQNVIIKEFPNRLVARCAHGVRGGVQNAILYKIYLLEYI